MKSACLSDNFTGTGTGADDALFERIADDILNRGISILPQALPVELANALADHLNTMKNNQFSDAAIGREQYQMQNRFVRTDAICWITGESAAGRRWLEWTSELMTHLNRKLLLGLFSCESHFAHYAPGTFYRRHRDAFKGEANRVLSLVVYLNRQWGHDDGGELVVYKDDNDHTGIRVTPVMGTLAAFLSEDFPHEVLPATRDRYSIATWFRVNSSTGERVDPPC
jgi:SM-20-related protein